MYIHSSVTVRLRTSQVEEGEGNRSSPQPSSVEKKVVTGPTRCRTKLEDILIKATRVISYLLFSSIPPPLFLLFIPIPIKPSLFQCIMQISQLDMTNTYGRVRVQKHVIMRLHRRSTGEGFAFCALPREVQVQIFIRIHINIRSE